VREREENGHDKVKACSCRTHHNTEQSHNNNSNNSTDEHSLTIGRNTKVSSFELFVHTTAFQEISTELGRSRHGCESSLCGTTHLHSAERVRESTCECYVSEFLESQRVDERFWVSQPKKTTKSEANCSLYVCTIRDTLRVGERERELKRDKREDCLSVSE
jgi:hypothetical protein